MHITATILPVRDSWYSYPRDELRFEIDGDGIVITFDCGSAGERIITVDRADFVRLLALITSTQEA